MKIEEFTIGELIKKVSGSESKYSGILILGDDETKYVIKVTIEKSE